MKIVESEGAEQPKDVVETFRPVTTPPNGRGQAIALPWKIG